MTAAIFIAMPVYRGAETVPETLRSIRAQTLEDHRVVMSVDGADDPTIDVCREFAATDPRLEVVVQPQRLGWPGNFNWLVEHCDAPYFCYWQQDDLASTGYLEALMAELATHPGVAIAHTDVQWFGAQHRRDSAPAVAGAPLDRVLRVLEALRYEPLRGLMRTSMLPPGPPGIPLSVDESCQEEFVFLAGIAARGGFAPVDRALYFKRAHRDSAYLKWHVWPAWRRRRGWITMGAGLHAVAAGLATDAERGRLPALVLDRLLTERPGRGFFYRPPPGPGETPRFVRDLTALARLQVVDAMLEPPGSLERPVSPEILDALRVERDAGRVRRRLADELATSGTIDVSPAAGAPGEALLGYGWSSAEPWGTWSDGGAATLRVPTVGRGPWRATLHAHIATRSARIGFTVDGGPTSVVEARATDPLVLTVEGSSSDGDAVVHLDLPDARAPSDDGRSADQRLLGIGLERITVEASPPGRWSKPPLGRAVRSAGR